jgi:response regulator RpfG family c-di-GMP phosphodiesterase
MTPEPAASVLIVDDENTVRDLMTRWLKAGGLSVTSASSADEALGHVEVDPPAVALCDIRMPGHDGVWLAERIRRRCPETAVIMATGVHDIGLAIESLRQGVVDYLTKPFGRDRLREAVSRGLEWHRAAWDARRWRETLERELDLRRARLSDAMTAVRIDSDEALDAMLSMVTLSDRDSYEHAHRVTALAQRLGCAMGLAPEDLKTLHHAALLHDVGKLAVPGAILGKPAPLTADERAIVRQHPQIGRQLVAAVPYLAAAADIIGDASERPDGQGYPRGIAAGSVALGARIIAVVEAFDTMTRRRVFRDPLRVADALLELERCKGSQFDPLVVDAFRALVTDESPARRR